MAKNVYLVSKTHLDLGFTDFAENIRKRYIEEFIPQAVDIAAELNQDGVKRFVWTTGSWILKEALQGGTDKQKAALREAMKKGDIVAHALPFTTHTELLDVDTLEYGIGIVKKLDKEFNRKTVAAKMTDVPGHTAAIVPILYKHGIKLLHIGVNEASALPNVPQTFLWKYGGGELIVIYEASYGGVYENPYIEDVLYFAHTNDNSGPVNLDKARENYETLKTRYPGSNIVASGLDEIAEKLWEVKDRLPVVTSEIGDSWIHGSASDPYKSAALRVLMSLKAKWQKDGSLKKTSAEYEGISDAALCIAEHTCGRDVKRFFSDYNHYLKKSFAAARKRDRVRLHPFLLLTAYPHNLNTFKFRRDGEYHKGSYSALEKSWEEQRNYIDAALDAMSDEHKKEAESALKKLIPEHLPARFGLPMECGAAYTFRDKTVTVNKFGALTLSVNGEAILKAGEGSALDYVSYGAKDYDFWLKHYTRNYRETMFWSVPDFARPGLAAYEGKYPQGRFPYVVQEAMMKETPAGLNILVYLDNKMERRRDLGLPARAVIEYMIDGGGIKISLSWFDKEASRLTEALFMRLYPAGGKLIYNKIGSNINPYDVADNGNRNISAVQHITFETDNYKVKAINRHAPLVSLGEGKILRFDNVFADHKEEGISYILYDNVWGTNFPLWYSQNAYFEVDVEIARKTGKQ